MHRGGVLIYLSSHVEALLSITQDKLLNPHTGGPIRSFYCTRNNISGIIFYKCSWHSLWVIGRNKNYNYAYSHRLCTLNPSWITNNGSGELSFADFVRRALIFFWTTYFLVNKFSNLPPLARMHI